MHKVVVPVFQPIVELATGRVRHYEALARTRDGSGGHIRLVELGEEYGFVDLIDMAMLRKVFAVLEDRDDLQFAVNISVVTIEQSCDELLALVFKNMFLAKHVVFEITETAEIRNLSLVKVFIAALRVAGGRVAVDDFGTGHFTHELVEQLKPDFLKLSNRVVKELATPAMRGEVLRLLALVRPFNGELIAEHVDSSEKVSALRELGVKYGQGYLFGAPERKLPSPMPKMPHLVAANGVVA